MRNLSLPKDAMFSNKTIILFIFPILIEQILIASLSMVDTLMVSRLPDSSFILAGIANVTRMDTLFKQIFVALGAGGGIFIAQFIGAKRLDDANKSLKMNMISMVFIAVIISVILEIFKVHILNFLFGKVEEEVMEQSLKYYSVTILSYPLMALFNCGCASLRSMEKSKMTLYASLIMMSVNIIFKYVFLFVLKMGVVGAGLSTLIAYGVTGIGLLIVLCNKKNNVHIDNIFKPEWDWKMLGKIYKVALPTGIENGLFQVGALILQTLIASLGTIAINANHIANTLTPMLHAPANAFTLGIIPFISQCMGANKSKEAEFYTKHILKLDHIITFGLALIVIPLTPFAIRIFGMSDDISGEAFKALLIYFICIPLIYPESFALANALRGAGDTKFAMCTSVITMFMFRIGLAYIFVRIFNLGILSTWIAMVSDWFVRGIIYRIRFRRGKWKMNCIIDI